MNETREKASQLQKQKKAAEDEKASLAAQLESIAADMEEIQKNIEAKEEELTAKEEELVQAKVEENNQYEDMKKRIKYMYENGETSALETILSAGSIAELLNRAEYAIQIAASDRGSLTDSAEATAAVRLVVATLQ